MFKTLKLSKTWRQVLWTGFLFAGFLLVIKTASAQGHLGDEWSRYLPGGIQDPGEGSGETLAINFILNAVVIVRYIVGGVALVMGGVYGMSLVFSRGNEEKISQQRQNFLWMLVGFIVLIISENLARILNPERSTSVQIVDFDQTRDQLRDIVDYIKWILGSVTVLFMAISGLRMVTAGGNEEEISKQKSNLTWSGIGLLVILLAVNIVNAIYFINSPTDFLVTGPEATITQIGGVIRLILVFLGPLAIAFTIYAGFFYLTALDNEERAQKAKKMILGGVVGIVIIYAAFALVNTVTSTTFATPVITP